MGASLEAIASKYVWWQPPAVTLARRDHFLCQLMTLGTADDVRAVRATLGDEAFIHALEHPAPGIMDPKSWSFWRHVFGLAVSPLPERPQP